MVWYSVFIVFCMLMGVGDDLVKCYDLSNFRYVLSVGELLNFEVVCWGMKVF